MCEYGKLDRNRGVVSVEITERLRWNLRCTVQHCSEKDGMYLSGVSEK